MHYRFFTFMNLPSCMPCLRVPTFVRLTWRYLKYTEETEMDENAYVHTCAYACSFVFPYPHPRVYSLCMCVCIRVSAYDYVCVCVCVQETTCWTARMFSRTAPSFDVLWPTPSNTIAPEEALIVLNLSRVERSGSQLPFLHHVARMFVSLPTVAHPS